MLYSACIRLSFLQISDANWESVIQSLLLHAALAQLCLLLRNGHPTTFLEVWLQYSGDWGRGPISDLFRDHHDIVLENTTPLPVRPVLPVDLHILLVFVIVVGDPEPRRSDTCVPSSDTSLQSTM